MSIRPGLGSVKPSLYIYEFNQNWQLIQKQLHNIDGLNYAHDFLLLPDYYVFHMTPFVSVSYVDVLKIYMGWSSPGEQMKYYPSLPSKFIVIPRNKQALHQSVMFIDTIPCHVSQVKTVIAIAL